MEVMRMAMREKGLTTRGLARAIGISDGRMARIKLDEQEDVSEEEARRLEEALGISMGYLLEEEYRVEAKRKREQWGEEFLAWAESRRRIMDRWRESGECRGFVECAVCGGKLHYSVAPNNLHVWAKCETPGCLEWME